MLYRVKMEPPAPAARAPAAVDDPRDALLAQEWRSMRWALGATAFGPLILYLCLRPGLNAPRPESLLYLLAGPLGLMAVWLGARALAPEAEPALEPPSVSRGARWQIRVFLPLAALALGALLLSLAAFLLWPPPILENHEHLALQNSLSLFSQPLMLFAACAAAGARLRNPLMAAGVGLVLGLLLGTALELLLPLLAPGELFRAPVVPSGPVWIEAIIYLLGGALLLASAALYVRRPPSV